ncbi:MAG TPA: vitamin K epoxide reductase family protein [Gemmatimonadaceae bacterium]|nr:vitamin K epoxide reductase family protein [Gemmatimonadaceae bacterium]
MSLRGYDRLRMTLTVAGLLIAGYLTLLHYDTDVPLVCSGGAFVNCEQVLTSASAYLLGVPVAVWGLAWFAVAFVLARLSSRARAGGEPAWLRAAGFGWVLAGTANVLWLVYQELGVIGKICAWCTAIHVVVLALLVIQVMSDPLRVRPAHT